MTPPTNWKTELMDKFYVMFERTQDDTMVEQLENFITQVRTEARREAFLEANSAISKLDAELFNAHASLSLMTVRACIHNLLQEDTK